MRHITLCACILLITLMSCEKKPEPGIEGLWIVRSVAAGENEMTPKGRWMRFNPDFTQESGNGWLQHSIGDWKLNETGDELTIVNSNGLDDPFEPFKVKLNETEMIWNRTEEGQALEIRLERAEHLPKTDSEGLYGLWKLTEATGDGSYFSYASQDSQFIFFRWDNRFMVGGPNGRINGVYNVHGHKPEVELIPYNDGIPRNFWKFEVTEDSVTMNLLNSDSLVTRTFTRIRAFPQ